MDSKRSRVPNSAQFNELPSQTDPLPRYNGIDRLKKRIGNYRQHHTVCSPRFDQSFNDACEQQSMETVVLQKRSFEHKGKKASKKTNKTQPQDPPINLPEVKMEPEFDHRMSPDFADLELCAAALEKDAATIGHFPGLAELIGDNALNDSDTFKDIISDLSDLDNADFPDFKQEPGTQYDWHKPEMIGLGSSQLGSSRGQSDIAMTEPLGPLQIVKQEHGNTMSMPLLRPSLAQNMSAQQVDLNRNVGGPRPFTHRVNNLDFINKNMIPSGAQFPIVPKQEIMMAQHQQRHQMPHIRPNIATNAFNKQQFPEISAQNRPNSMVRPNVMRFPQHHHRPPQMLRAPQMRPQMVNWTSVPNSSGIAMQPQHQVYMQQQHHRLPYIHAMAGNAHTSNTDWRNNTMMPHQQSINLNDNGNSLEFLQNLAVGDASNFPAQDLLSSLDSVVTADDFDDILGSV